MSTKTTLFLIPFAALSFSIPRGYSGLSSEPEKDQLNIIIEKSDTAKIMSCIPKEDTYQGEEVYATAEKSAVFPGGDVAFQKYMRDNLKPDDFFNEWGGKVYVTFIIDKTGEARDICYIRPQLSLTETQGTLLYTMLDEMPLWEPAEEKGQKVHFRVVLPLNISRK